jgi:uncharacterized protein YkwD
MSKPARWSTYASFFGVFLSACGGDDEKPSETQEDPVVSCTTLVNLPCSCAGGGYGIYSCDSKCLQCPVPVAGAGATAGTPAATTGAAGAGVAGRGGSGRGMFPGGAAGSDSSAAVPPPTGIAGMTAAPGAAGAAAGSGGTTPAAGSGGMMAAAGSGATTTGDVPATAVCQPVSNWPADAAMFETEVLRLVNENRAKGWNCDTEGQKPAVGPLMMEPTLRCSARLHSKDMADQMYFAHDGLDGSDPGTRMTAAGYVGRTWGENIAKGQTTPQQVVQGWMDSDGHCSNIMNGSFNLIGVGYFAGMSSNTRFNSELYWTQNFGAAGGSTPRR